MSYTTIKRYLLYCYTLAWTAYLPAKTKDQQRNEWYIHMRSVMIRHHEELGEYKAECIKQRRRQVELLKQRKDGGINIQDWKRRFEAAQRAETESWADIDQSRHDRTLVARYILDVSRRQREPLYDDTYEEKE